MRKKHRSDRVNKVGSAGEKTCKRDTCQSRRPTDFRPDCSPHELPHESVGALDMIYGRYQVASLPKATAAMSTEDTVGQDESTSMVTVASAVLFIMHLLEGRNHFTMDGQRKGRGSIL